MSHDVQVELSETGRQKVADSLDRDDAAISLEESEDFAVVQTHETTSQDTEGIFPNTERKPGSISVGASAAAAGSIGGYIIASLNYATATATPLEDLITASGLGGAIILLAIVVFWLGVLVEQTTGGDGA